MRIGSTILSLVGQRMLSRTNQVIARSLERLSSGSRINSAKDDAAGLAVGEKLNAQVRGFRQIIRNINDSLGYIDTADAVLRTQSDLIQRMRELSMQSANGILSDTDRGYLNTEFQELLSEWKRLNEDSQFGGNPLFSSSDAQKSIQIGLKKGETINLEIPEQRENIFEVTLELDEPIAEGTYATRTTYSTGIPTDILSTDLNGDGYNDVLVSSTSAARVYVYLNDQDGTFTAASPLLAGGNSFDMDLGDINGDGNTDVIVSQTHGGGVYGFSVFLGNGNGTFQTRITTAITGLTGVGEPQLSDLNGDNHLDVVYAYGSLIYTLLGNGDGRFQSPSTMTAGAITTVNDMALEDINGDGRDDIIIGANSNAYINIFLGQAGGTFASATTSGTILSIDAIDLADVDDDGDLDLLAGNGSNGLSYVFLGNGNGTFSGTQTFYDGSGVVSSSFADMDGDGDQDILLFDGGSVDQALIFSNDGAGTFTLTATSTVGDGGGDVLGVDIDGDGIADLLSTSGTDQTFSAHLQNSETEITITIDDMNIANQEDAENSLSQLDQALGEILTDLSTLGAQRNRLEYVRSSTETMVQNLSEARSQIYDADIAEEIAELTKAMILKNSIVAVLAQANLNFKLVSDLLSNISR